MRSAAQPEQESVDRLTSTIYDRSKTLTRASCGARSHLGRLVPDFVVRAISVGRQELRKPS